MVTQTGVPAVAASSDFRLFAQTSGDFKAGSSGSIQTGIAITNPSSAVVTVNLEVTDFSGASLGLTGSIQLSAHGQAALFLNQIPGFSGLQNPFEGVLRIYCAASPVVVVGLRGRYNERQDFLVTTTPPVDENSSVSSQPMYFPQVADGGGYTTQFILLSGSAGQPTSGELELFSASGQSLGLNLLFR